MSIEHLLPKGRIGRAGQAVRCFLNTHHWYVTDMGHYADDYGRVLAARRSGEKIVYRCLTCGKQKRFA